MKLRLLKYILPAAIMLLISMPYHGQSHPVVERNKVEWVSRRATPTHQKLFARAPLNDKVRHATLDWEDAVDYPAYVLAYQSQVFVHHTNHPKDWLRRSHRLPHSDGTSG